MKIELLTHERVNEFVSYCKKHRIEIDDSFLYDNELEAFKPSEENPTYIATNQKGELIATASLIINDYYRRGKQGRFRIFHSEIQDDAIYKMLSQAILNHTEGLKELFIYIPTVNDTLIKALEGIHFIKERYAFLLVRKELPVPEFSLPKGFRFQTFQFGKDEETWCHIRNIAFAELKGSQTPITDEMVAKYHLNQDYIEGGMKILIHKEKPVGIIRVSKDEYQGAPIANIGPVALIPEYHGRGLGRTLLREGLKLAKEHDFKSTILSVNGENERAIALYLQEGFEQVESVICYQLFL